MVLRSARGSYPMNAVPFLKSVEHGSDVDIRTPLFNGDSREKVAEEWMDMLDGSQTVLFPGLLELEMKQKTKIGSLSRRKPYRDRKQDILSYYTSGLNDGFTPEFRRFKDVRNGRLRPLTYEHSAQLLPHNSNSGLPLFKRRGKVVSSSIKLSEIGHYYPALLGWRGQSSGKYWSRQRVVWMFPFSTNIIENRFFRPVHDSLVHRHPFSAWRSMRDVEIGVSKLIDSGHDILSSDFSGYDQSLTYQQSWYFNLLREMFQERYHPLLYSLEENLRTIPIVVNSKDMFTGKHGMPSGSNFTNQADSIVNLQAQDSSPVAVPELTLVQGDDAVVAIRGSIDVHINHLRLLGFDVNEEKQHVSRDTVMYLQRIFYKGYRYRGQVGAVYPTMRALNATMGQERSHKGMTARLASLRIISILENCSRHPLFETFVNFVANRGDKYLRIVAHELCNSNHRKELLRQASQIPGFVPAYNQDKVLSGIINFRTVRVLNKS